MLPSNSPGVAPLAALALAALLGGCALGPDYVRPPPPAAASYTAADAATAGTGTLAPGTAPPADWWTLFAAPRLDATMQLAVQDNHDLAGAQARLAQAAALAHAATAVLYPQVEIDAGAGHQKLGAASLGNADFPAFTYFSVGPAVHFDLDYTGGARRALEEQAAQVDAQGFALAAQRLSLTGNVALAALHIAAARAQIDSLQFLLGEDASNAQFVQASFDAGAVSRVDVLSAQTQLANDQTLLAPLQQQLSIARHQLSVLVGRAPAQWSPPDFDIKEFSRPATLPLSLPSELVRRRPDILAAEAQLHAATAALGVATADLYPRVTLSAGFGWQATDAARLFDASSVVGSLMAGLAGPLYDHGARQDRRSAAQLGLRAALERYTQTILVAFGQVADLLDALDHDAQLEQAQQRAVDAARANLELTRLSYRAGNVGVLQVLDAQRASEQAQLGLVRAQAQGLQDAMELVVAMGGAAPPVPADPSAAVCGAPGCAAAR